MDKSTLSTKFSPQLVFRPTDSDGKRVDIDPAGVMVTSSDPAVISDGQPVEVVAEDETAPGGAGNAYKVTCPATGDVGQSAVLSYTLDVDPGAGVQTIEGQVEIDFIHEFAQNAGLSVVGVPRTPAAA